MENPLCNQEATQQKQWIYEAHLVIVDLFYRCIVQFWLCLSVSLSLYHTYTPRVFKSITLCLTPLRVQSDLVDEKNWLYSWTNIRYYIWKKPHNFQIPSTTRRHENRKEINHLENFVTIGTECYVYAAILNSFIWFMALRLTMIILSFMNFCVCVCSPAKARALAYVQNLDPCLNMSR